MDHEDGSKVGEYCITVREMLLEREKANLFKSVRAVGSLMGLPLIVEQEVEIHESVMQSLKSFLNRPHKMHKGKENSSTDD